MHDRGARSGGPSSGPGNRECLWTIDGSRRSNRRWCGSGDRGTPTVIVVGDGGVRMYPEAIALAVRERLPVLVMLMNDGSYASIRQVAMKKGYTQIPLRLQNCAWPEVFHGFGCPSERIESLPALARAIESWRQSSGPLFLDLAFDPDGYLSITEGIR